MDKKIEKYILEHIDAEEEYLTEILRQTYLKTVNPQMLAGHLQGKILKMLSQMIQPKNILEIGTFTGYSALCLAAGLQNDGQLFTIESNDEMENMIRTHLENSPFREKIKLLIGNALDIIPTLNLTFDLVYIDADKREYCEYFDKIFEKVNLGGYILVDNVLWAGKVVEKNDMDAQTLAIRKFNTKIKNDFRLEKVILPIRDGIMCIRKKIINV